MRKHVLILLLITLLTRGIMFISYPFGGEDDNQAAQNNLINELVHGNLLIGNLRFNTGYPLVIAPVTWLAQPLGRFDDRLVLLVQVALASTIPFLIYDILRKRRSESEAFFVALVVALNPFGWQWAHLTLPVWLVAFCVTLALWLIHRGLGSDRWLLGWVATAGFVLGTAVLARVNFAPVVAVLGLAFFTLRRIALRKRLALFITLGVTSAGILLAYMVLIHVPSTGTWTLSCVGALNLLTGLLTKEVPIVAENGPDSAYLLQLLTLEPRDMPLLSDTYPRWREPGPWATEAEQATFWAQSFGDPDDAVHTAFPGALIYYMGPCPLDTLLNRVDLETIRAYPLHWIGGTILSATRMLVNQPEPGFDNLYVPRYDTLQGEGESRFGFQQINDRYYNGQIVWVPGIKLYTIIAKLVFPILGFLLPFALVWCLRSRDWFYLVGLAIMIIVFGLTAAVNRAEPRYYAMLYPFSGLILGGFLYAGFRWVRERVRASGAARP